MILVLKDGRKIEVNRMNCGFQYKDAFGEHRAWNASPIDWMSGKYATSGMRLKKSFFVKIGLGHWGSEAYDYDGVEEMIPLTSVVSIEKPGEWG